jgi:[acyl-carrier-protein] S-malonyltransferase
LQNPELAFVFPAFVNEYPADATTILPGFEIQFRTALHRAADAVASCLTSFSFDDNNFLEDEFKTQFVTYAYSCAMSDILREQAPEPAFLSGFSMGLYAALYHAGSITYESGLRLISKAYLDSIQCLKSRHFTMGTTIGLSLEDLTELMERNSLPVEITNLNSRYAITFAGLYADVSGLLEKAAEAGALKTRMLKVSVPYHTRFLASVAETFSAHVREVEIRPPNYPVISQIDQSVLHGPVAIREELVKNLYTHLSWMHTLEKLLELGARTLVECGPGRSLTKNSRFIEGDFRFIHPDAILL